MESVEGAEGIRVSMTRRELLLLANSVNEALEAVEDWEFSTRLGVPQDDARALLTELNRVIAELPRNLD